MGSEAGYHAAGAIKITYVDFKCCVQACILFGWGPKQSEKHRAPQEMWAQRVEMMQLELGALTQRVEALGGELRMAAEHLAAARTGTNSALG